MGKKWRDPCARGPWAAGPGVWQNSMQKNNITFNMYFQQLKALAVSVFEWKNLPEEIDPRFLELCLFDKGVAVFFKDDVVDLYVALTTMISGQLDIYNIPKERRAYAPNGYQVNLDSSNSVLIWNNYLHMPDFQYCLQYAERLYEIQRAIDVNVKGQKFPIAILADESQRLTMKNLYMQYDGNEPFIFGSKNLQAGLESMKTINTSSPFVADNLMDLKHQIWNEALTWLGIDNANTDKRERLITDEVQSNMGTVEANRYVRLNARRDAAEQINRMFGLDISVDLRYNIDVTEKLSDGENNPTEDREDQQERSGGEDE